MADGWGTQRAGVTCSASSGLRSANRVVCTELGGEPNGGRGAAARSQVEGVRSHRADTIRLGERFGVRNIRIFGSVARGEAGQDSDLDLLVDVDRGHGYFDMAGFALGVEDRLGVFTQVATPRGLKERIRDRVLQEAVAL